MKKALLAKIKELKEYYAKSGFIIVGVFGSYARNEEKKDSDIDLIYEVTQDFIKQYGWGAVIKLEEIKNEISKELQISKVDLTPKNSQNKTLQKILQKELLYV